MVLGRAALTSGTPGNNLLQCAHFFFLAFLQRWMYERQPVPLAQHLSVITYNKQVKEQDGSLLPTCPFQYIKSLPRPPCRERSRPRGPGL